MGAWPAVAVATAVLLGGCAVGQKFSYVDSAIPIRSIGARHTMMVAVLDQRAYVMSGNKPESFVGLSRGGFGNPFDVNTRSGGPLATDMSMGIAEALRAKGVAVKTITVRPADGMEQARQALVQTRSGRNLLFILKEWKTDTMMRTGLDYDVTLEVLDSAGARLAQSRVMGKEVSGGSILSAEKDAQRWFTEKMAELLRDAAVQAALE